MVKIQQEISVVKQFTPTFSSLSCFLFSWVITHFIPAFLLCFLYLQTLYSGSLGQKEYAFMASCQWLLVFSLTVTAIENSPCELPSSMCWLSVNIRCAVPSSSPLSDVYSYLQEGWSNRSLLETEMLYQRFLKGIFSLNWWRKQVEDLTKLVSSLYLIALEFITLHYLRYATTWQEEQR